MEGGFRSHSAVTTHFHRPVNAALPKQAECHERCGSASSQRVRTAPGSVIEPGGILAVPESKNHDCVLCGSCVVDILVRPVPLETAIGGGRLIQTDPIGVTTGGVVSNSGIALARLGMRVAAFSYVGDDQWATVIRNRYAAEGIDTSRLLTHPTGATSTTAVLIDPSGDAVSLIALVRRSKWTRRCSWRTWTCLRRVG